MNTMKMTVAIGAMGLAAGCGAVVAVNAPERFAPAFSMPDGMSPEELAADPAKQQAMMAEWASLNAPSERHEMLGYFAGEWETSVKMWFAPGQEPMMTGGTASAEMMMGGRFLRMTYDTDMMGMSLKGEGFIGFDNVAGKYQSMWMDTGTTAMRYLEGHSNRDGSEIALYGKMDEPQLGVRERLVSYVFRLIDADTYEMDVNDLLIGPEDNTAVKITFSRKK